MFGDFHCCTCCVYVLVYSYLFDCFVFYVVWFILFMLILICFSFGWVLLAGYVLFVCFDVCDVLCLVSDLNCVAFSLMFWIVLMFKFGVFDLIVGYCACLLCILLFLNLFCFLGCLLVARFCVLLVGVAVRFFRCCVTVYLIYLFCVYLLFGLWLVFCLFVWLLCTFCLVFSGFVLFVCIILIRFVFNFVSLLLAILIWCFNFDWYFGVWCNWLLIPLRIFAVWLWDLLLFLDLFEFSCYFMFGYLIVCFGLLFVWMNLDCFAWLIVVLMLFDFYLHYY